MQNIPVVNMVCFLLKMISNLHVSVEVSGDNHKSLPDVSRRDIRQRFEKLQPVGKARWPRSQLCQPGRRYVVVHSPQPVEQASTDLQMKLVYTILFKKS